MADSNYRTLQAVDDDTTAGGPRQVDPRTYQDPAHNAYTPSPIVEDPQAGHSYYQNAGDPRQVYPRTYYEPAYNAYYTPSPIVEDAQAGHLYYQNAPSSEPTTFTNNAFAEGQRAPESDAPQHDTPFLSGPDNATPPDSQEQTRPRGGKSRFQESVVDVSAERQYPRWRSFYFGLPFLVSFSILLAAIIAGLEILDHFSKHNQGLVTASERMHYAWTYGPTFVLTMVAVLWNQLDQCAKQIMPWALMSRGETTSKHSLMLNYITSSMLGALCRSLKRGHFLVSLAILGSLILRLAIIFSSGLLRLEYKSVISTGELILQDTFNLTRDVDYVSFRNFIPIANSLGYWGTIKYGLSYPSGVTPQFAVQSFIPSEDGAYDDLTGEAQVFESTLQDCDPFTFTYGTDGNLDIFRKTMRMTAPESLQEKLKPWCYDYHANYDTSGPDDFSGSLAGGILEEFLNITQLVWNCSDTDATREDQEYRILFTSESWIAWNESEVSGFMCKPTYSLTGRTVTNITQDSGIHDNLTVTGPITETLDIGIQPFNVTKKILLGLGSEQPENVVDIEWNFWFALLNITQPQTNISSFRNTSLTIDISKQAWQGLAAYVAKRDYMSPLNQTLNGTLTSTQGRLSAQELPLRVIEALIALLLLFSVALCFLRPGVFHRDPTSLGAHAIILARSPDLMGLLDGLGAAPKQALRNTLSGILAAYPRAHPPESPAISLQQFRTGSQSPTEEATAGNSDTRKWWQPIPVRLWYRIIILIATVGAMIALEVLLQVSSRGDGLGNVSLDGYLKYTWSLLPAFLLALIGLLFSLVDSTARTAHPFQLLRKGRASLADILYDPGRQVSLVAVGRAAWKRHFPLLWALLPSLLAPVLTIISSGLYSVVPVPWTYDAELQLQDWFRDDSRTDGRPYREDEAGTVYKLIEYNGMPYPNWTQGEYALSRFGADNLRSHDGNDTALFVTARVPAVRVNQNCSLIEHYSGESYQDLLSANIGQSSGAKYLPIDPGPLGCDTAPEYNQTTGHRSIWLHISGISSNKGYYITAFGDDYDNYYLQRYHHFVETERDSGICGDWRQHRFVALAKDMEELALLHCAPYVEALWVNATFSLPGLSLVTDVPIAPDMDSSVFLSDSYNMTAWPSVDDVFSVMVNGTSKVGPLAPLMPGPGDEDASKLSAALQPVVGEYQAQNIHLNFRVPLDGNNTDDPLTADGQPVMGRVTDRTRLRLVQNEISTRILESILAAMVVCLVTASVLDRGVRIIPRDPGSVASRMAYFAGGEMWRHVPVGADRWKDKEIIKWGRENSEGKRLLLDWRGRDDTGSSEDGTPPPSADRPRRFAVDSAGRKGAA